MICRAAPTAPNGGMTTRRSIRAIRRRPSTRPATISRRTPDGGKVRFRRLTTFPRRADATATMTAINPARRHGVSRHADAAAVRGAGARIFRKARPRRRSQARAELRGAAQGPGRWPLPDRPRRRRSMRGAGRGVEGGRHRRGRRRQRLQSSVRPAGDRAHRRSARPNAGRRRRQHRLVVRALRNPQAARPRPAATSHSRGRRAVPPLRGDARRQDHGGGDPQSAVRDPRPARRAEGHGRGGRYHRALSRHGALCAARMGAANAGTLIAYLAASIEGLRWTLTRQQGRGGAGSRPSG